MKLTWYGHSAFRIETADAKILIDPYLIGNPSWTGGWEGPAGGITHVLLTHGHNDHISGALEVLGKSGAQLVANFEICVPLISKGVSDKEINRATSALSIAAASPPRSSRRCTPPRSPEMAAKTPISAILVASSCTSRKTGRSTTWAIPTSFPTWL